MADHLKNSLLQTDIFAESWYECENWDNTCNKYIPILCVQYDIVLNYLLTLYM